MNFKNPAHKRYLYRFFPAMAAYVVLFSIADGSFHRHHPTGLAAVLLALAPGLAIVASIVVVGLYLAEERDEFQRSLLVRSLVWAIGLTLAFTTVRGFLELYLPIGKFPLYAVYPLFWIIVGVSQGIHEWYYGGCHE